MDFITENHTVSREIDNKWGIMTSLCLLGEIALRKGDLKQAYAYFNEVSVMARAYADRYALMGALYGLGTVARWEGEYDQAIQYHSEELELGRLINHAESVAEAHYRLGAVARLQGDTPRARFHFRESMLAISPLLVTQLCEDVAAWCAAHQQPRQALTLFGGANALRTTIQVLTLPLAQQEYNQTITAVRTQLDVAAAIEAWDAGQTMTLEEARAYVGDIVETME